MPFAESDLSEIGIQETVDSIGDGKIVIAQNKNGYRFSIDAILLAAFIEAKSGDRILEIGAGSGVILICLLTRVINANAVGVEIQPQIATLAKRNIALNGMERRAEIICEDIEAYAKRATADERFDVIFFNPPYRGLGSGRINTSEEKAIARHEIKGSLSSFLVASRDLLARGGRIFFIYPATRFAEAMSALKRNGIAAKKVVMAHSRVDSPAELALFCAIKSQRDALTVLPPVILYEGTSGAPRRYTKQAERIIQTLCWPSLSGGE